MKEKKNFTADRVAGFKCTPPQKQALYWDAKSPGLGVRVTSGGAKSYIFESRLHGRKLRVTIGSTSAWPIAKAQTEAARLKTLVDQGIDPRQESLKQRAAAEAAQREIKRQSVTVAEAWSRYLEERRPYWSELHYRDHVDLSSLGGRVKKRGKGLTEPGPLAPLMPLKLTELRSETIADWMKREAAVRPTRTKLAFNLLRIFARWCESNPEYRGLILPHAIPVRLARDMLPRSQPKNDALQREQLKPWFQAVQQLKSPVMSVYLIGLLLTGARREELAGLKWQDVDFRWGSLTIRDKVEGIRVIPLTGYLSSLLLQLKRLNETPPNKRQMRRQQSRGTEWQPSLWVFFSAVSEEGNIDSPNAAHHRVCKAAGIPPVTVHGLRRSFGSLAEWVEVPTGVVAQIMGHKPSATAERHYRVRPLDLLRMWHQKIETWILEQAGIEAVNETSVNDEPCLKSVA